MKSHLGWGALALTFFSSTLGWAESHRIGRPYLECQSKKTPILQVEIFQRPVRSKAEAEFLMSVDFNRGAQIPELSNIELIRDEKAQEHMGLQSYFRTEKFKGSNGLHFSLAISKKLKSLGYEAKLTQFSQTGAELLSEKVFCSYYVAFGFQQESVSQE